MWSMALVQCSYDEGTYNKIEVYNYDAPNNTYLPATDILARAQRPKKKKMQKLCHELD